MDTVVAQGCPISEQYVAPLMDSTSILSQAHSLKKTFDDQGYVFLPKFFQSQDIEAVRENIFSQLASVGEINEPVAKGIFSGQSKRKELHSDLGKFWRSVSESWTLRRLSHGQALHEVMDVLLGEASRVQDYVFLRPAGPGKYTNVHCDSPFFTRTTDKVATAWIALGDIPTRMGPLFIVENSHKIEELVEPFRHLDYDAKKSMQATLSDTPAHIAEKFETRLLTTNFQAGDAIIFNMHLFHGALDNVSDNGEIRLSCDVRYQIASAPQDPRYFGPDPTGTTGAGYGELVGAKPMTEEWHQR